MSTAPLPRLERNEHGMGLASWYAAGRSDGFGDRLLMFDNTGAASFELLRFRPDLAVEPGFEDLLRQRVQRLASFQHPSFASIRAVEHLEGGEGLALVSNHTPGKRLSELLAARGTAGGLHPAFVSWLLQQIAPHLAALQGHGYDIVHGALTLDRFVLTPDGRVVIVEHALGSALRGLELSPARLWREFGIVARSTSRGEACLDARGDILQVGVVALSLLLGRVVPLDEVQRDVSKLVDEFAALPQSRGSLFTDPLRRWLQRALQIHPQAYRSAAEAHDGIKELPESASTLPALLGSLLPAADPSAESAATRPALAWPPPGDAASPIRLAPPAEPDHGEAIEAVAVSETVTEPAVPGVPLTDPGEAAPTVTSADRPAVELVAVLPPPAADIQVVPRAELDLPAVAPDSSPASFTSPGGAMVTTVRQWALPGLAALAAIEAVIIGIMLWGRSPEPVAAAAAATPVAVTIDAGRPGAEVFVDERRAGTSPLRLTLDGTSKSIRIEAPAPVPPVNAAAPAVVPTGNDATAATLAQAAARQRSGGVRFTSSIPLQVLEGNRLLGNTQDGPIVATAGTHQLDLVNTELGFRTQQSVTVRAGEIATFRVVTPTGRLSVNAQPWAQVWVDQNPVGETPIANLSVALGQHEVTFRHPQLGERKEIVVVRADGVTRLSTTFGR